MASDLRLIDGSTYFLSDLSGDVEARQAAGFFHRDMRHLSRWRLHVDGAPVHVLASAAVDYYSARIVAIRRYRFGATASSAAACTRIS
jgi:hypothetical protein